jgi:Ca2+-binding EF-hand superfamily protein
LGADKNLAEKLFYVFDEDQSGTVDYKELIVGLEVLKDDSIEEKLKSIIKFYLVFFDLCDLDGSGKISEKEIFNVLKSNIVSESDKYQLK